MDECRDRPQVRKVLSHFDSVYRDELSRESRALSDPNGTLMGNSALPVSVVRSVITEALSDLHVLEVCNVFTDPKLGSTIQIPYEERLPGIIVNDGIVYEEAEIPRAAVRQAMYLAYVNAMKLSFVISNELDFFSRTSLIDWNALDRNTATNAQMTRERVHMRICNEHQRAADSFEAVAVISENIAAQLSGSGSLIKTAKFPVVRPFQTRDLQGSAIGPEENPLSLIINGDTIPHFDYSGSQPAGTYWLCENWNLGYFRLVNAQGVPVTPTAVAAEMSYSHGSNCTLFDTKLPEGVTRETHNNGILRAIGVRKAILFNDRKTRPDFVLCGAHLLNEMEDADQFSEMDRVAGTQLDKTGAVSVIRGMRVYGTNAPGIHFGDERILIGEAGTLTYAIARPWSVTPAFEAVGATGRPTGQLQAYSEEYNALIVPPAIRGRLTSVVCYDSDARAAAV